MSLQSEAAMATLTIEGYNKTLETFSWNEPNNAEVGITIV
jgi:hypothetical protein